MKNIYMKKYIMMAVILLGYTANSQIGIGTTTPEASSALDVSSSDKGFLTPRIALTGSTDVTTIAAPATGLLIYNTATAGTAPNTVVPGYYYWNGTKWATLDNGATAANSWNTTGNSSTTAGTNFIGTTDNTDVVLKRNNIVSGFIGSTNTAFGNSGLSLAATGTGNTAIGSNALTAVTTGGGNTAIGYNTLSKNTAPYNTAIGNTALYNTTSGDSNTAVGNMAMTDNTTGRMGTALGFQALNHNTTASYNTAMGGNAGFSNITGTYNAAVGYQSLYNSSAGNNNVAIGSGALFSLQDPAGTNSHNNVAIGTNVGMDLFMGSNNILIGANVMSAAPGGIGSNILNIGSNIYGTNVNNGGYANIGINTANPGNALEVRSSAANTSGLRLTNFPNAGMLGTNSQGDIIETFSAIKIVTVSYYEVQLADETILMNVAAPAAVVLPAGAVSGKRFIIKKIDATSSNMVIAAAGGATIDNQASITIGTSMAGIVVQFDGISKYWIVNRM